MRGTTLHYTQVFTSVTRGVYAIAYYVRLRSSQVIVRNGMHRLAPYRRLSMPWTIKSLVPLIAFQIALNGGPVRNYFIHP